MTKKTFELFGWNIYIVIEMQISIDLLPRKTIIQKCFQTR